ncbi:MAG: PilZ domain-containing protein [Candidatus Hydrogenedentota bacterium]
MEVKSKRLKFKGKLDVPIESDLNIIISKGKFKGEYVSKVLEKTRLGLIIEYPKKDDELIPFKIGNFLFARYHTKDGNYEFETRLVASQKEPQPFLYVMNPFNIYKLQFRSYVRVDTMINAEAAEWDEEKEIDLLEKLPCKIINISGGGAALKTSKPFQKNKKLLLSFILPGQETPLENIVSNIIRCDKESEEEYKVILEYISIKDSDRDLIIHYTYSEQIRLKRKGLI